MREIGLKIRGMEEVISLLRSLGVFNYANGDKYDGEWTDDIKRPTGKFLN